MSRRYPALGACRRLSPLEPEPARERAEEMEMDEAEERLARSDGMSGGETPEERDRREARESERLHDTDPGRWAEWTSPARMRRDRERDAEEDER